ncbi:ATP-binding protein [Paenibacillus sp. TRM 82003]|uniref:ATP-binding protein n=1 Tax=Kineococcus sp. TRM81007 TaxID=2925831 RepID=UPI001F56A240|nr:ATP-binding protein [Kineococcus sp. TRM81007]MCI2240548.1 ATP-binding protein [Kineococcus sp. TRM81007]MCI3918927.1 ATP-binding protein [Paenibacillus sp. TRM 82003]
MATAAQVKALVESHSLGDDARFRSVVLQIAEAATRTGRTRHAEEVRALLDAGRTGAHRSAGAPGAVAARPVPVAQPRGELAQVLTVQQPPTRLADVALGGEVMGRLHRVLAEQRRAEALLARGFDPVRRLLLTGPPGTGKSLTAEALAGELLLPLFSVRLDALADAPADDSAARLRLVFDLVAQTRGVYLFDDLDALAEPTAPERGAGLRDVLRAFTALLEQDTSTSVLVATTCRPQLLERWVLRRFDALLDYPLPTTGVVHEVVLRRLRGFDLSAVEWPRVASTASGMSHEEVSAAAESAAKQSILQGDRHVETTALLAALRERRQMLKMAP